MAFEIYKTTQGRICLQYRRPGFDSWIRNIPCRGEWLPTPVFLPGVSHGSVILSHTFLRYKTIRCTVLLFGFHLSRKSLQSSVYIDNSTFTFIAAQYSLCNCTLVYSSKTLLIVHRSQSFETSNTTMNSLGYIYFHIFQAVFGQIPKKRIASQETSICDLASYCLIPSTGFIPFFPLLASHKQCMRMPISPQIH